MDGLSKLLAFLEKLEANKLCYELKKVRQDAIMVEVVIPGQHWEIEFNTYGEPSSYQTEIEIFRSDGVIYDEKKLELLFQDDLDGLQE